MVKDNSLEPIDRKLTQHGNSVAIVVPKSIREMFGWSDTQKLKVPFHLFEKMED